MSADVTIKYYGWSNLSIETRDGALFFDPFFRPYCGAEWFHLQDFKHATYICVTHGHEEHFLDVPVIAKETAASVIGAPSVCRFLARRHKIAAEKLNAIEPARFESVTLPGFKITAFPWKHRDINLYKALTKAVFHTPREVHPLIDTLAQGMLFESPAKFDRMQQFLDRKK